MPVRACFSYGDNDAVKKFISSMNEKKFKAQCKKIQYHRHLPSNQIFLVLNGFSQWLAKHQLYKVLQLGIYISTNGINENCLHSSHQHLQSFNHCYYFNERKSLLVRVIVACRLLSLKKKKFKRLIFFLDDNNTFH